MLFYQKLCVLAGVIWSKCAVLFQMVMLVMENPLLVDSEALEKCRKVMELICEKCVKQQDMNEVLAMKMHYISCVLQKCSSFLKDSQDKLESLIKRYGIHSFIGFTDYSKQNAVVTDLRLDVSKSVILALNITCQNEKIRL